MRYYIVEIQITPDDKSIQAIYEIEGDLDTAITRWYGNVSSMRTAVDQGTLKEITCFVANSAGGVDPRYNATYSKQAE